MRQKVTLRRIAAELEISQVTVLRALSGRPGVSPDLRKTILQVAGKKKYSLPNHKTGNIALVIPGCILSGYLGLLVCHLNRELHKHGLCTYVVTESDIKNINDCLFDGLLSTLWNAGFEKRFPKDHSLPVVCVNAKDNRMENIYNIATEEREGIMRGMELLYKTGHRRIAFLTPQDTENICQMERIQSYHDFCKKHCIFQEKLLLNARDNESIEEKTDKLIELRADALFYANEDNIFRVYNRLRQRGKRIPEDISIIGLEQDSHSEFMDPPLTALRQNFEKLAEYSVRMLIKLINREPVTEGIRVPYQLFERNSICNKGID